MLAGCVQLSPGCFAMNFQLKHSYDARYGLFLFLSPKTNCQTSWQFRAVVAQRLRWGHQLHLPLQIQAWVWSPETQEKACSAGTPTPSMGLWHITTRVFSVASAPGWLFWCPQKCCLSWTVLVTGWGTPNTKIRKADFTCHKLDKPLKFWRWNMLSK